MGRRRKDGNPLGLEPRLYPHHGQLWYRHRNGDAEPMGTDVAKANERAKVYNDPDGRYGTLGHFIDLFIAEARAGRLLTPHAVRTVSDWEKREAPMLKLVFDKKTPDELVRDPSLITKYRDNRTAKVRCNRELSLLSSVYGWIIEQNHCPGLIVNPVKLIQRNPESPKDRYVEDDEYWPVYAIAQRSVCMAMELVYRTLQRPEDVLKACAADIRMKSVGGTTTRVFSVVQNKTSRRVDIEVSAELEAALTMLSGGAVARLSRYLVHDLGRRKRVKQKQREDRYTVDGIGAMIRRYCKAAGVKTFGLMDVRAKGATDMYLRGVPLERIQLLMGHASVKTTEIYIKRLLQTISIVPPNDGVPGRAAGE
jgi:integrase